MEEKLDIFDPGIIMAIIFGVIGDAAMIVGVLAVAIPVVGIIVAGFAALAHYISAIIVIAIFWRHIRGWLACLVLILAGILPLPLLTIGVVLAILFSNKLIAFIAEQAAIQAIAVFTAGAGEALEGAAAAETAANAAKVTAEAGKAVSTGVRAAETAGKGAEVVEKGSKAAKQAQRVINVANRLENIEQQGGAPEENEGGEEQEEALREAAAEKEMESGAEITPEEEAAEKIFGMPKPEHRQNMRESNEGRSARKSNVVSGEEFRKRAEEIKQKQKKLPKMIDVNEPDSDDRQAAA